MKQETNGQERGRAKNRSRDHRPADQNREKKMNRKPENRPEKTGASRPQPKASNSAAQKKNTAPGRTYRYLAYVSFKESRKVYSFGYDGEDLKVNDRVVVETVRGQELGTIVKDCEPFLVQNCGMEIKPVLRMADGMDVRRMRQNRADERSAFTVCEQRIAAHGLQMKLIDAEYTLDRNKLVFYFTADSRVDFRELVKDLAAHFHTRIELRQIGVRDESKMLGGLGVCGQPFCCSRFLKNFQPVSIKMAKEQGLSLNPAKISGACGRLMCCLAYEQKSYEYLNSITPQPGSVVRTPDGEGTVVEANVVSGMLKVRSHVESLAPKFYHRTECTYLRGGRRAPAKPRPEE